jgi:hypothetical protein
MSTEPKQAPEAVVVSKSESDVDPAVASDRGPGAVPTADKLKEAAAFLLDVAEGRRPFELTKGNASLTVSNYAYHAVTHLAGVLGTTRKEAVTLALCYYIRALTGPQISAQNDLAMLTSGLQFVVQDLAQEVAEFNALAVSIANQEAVAGPAV